MEQGNVVDQLYFVCDGVLVRFCIQLSLSFIIWYDSLKLWDAFIYSLSLTGNNAVDMLLFL